ncbi:MAG: hypothetical protein L0Y71_05540 [Gemmataceae bacterium]|nr:hypothetical protein [Gemmataceae bacterium]
MTRAISSRCPFRQDHLGISMRTHNLEIREVIAVIDEPSNSSPQSPAEDIFAEMEPFTVKAGGADYSRQTLYTRLEGE